MASLQARHTRSCAIGRPWTAFSDAQEGCTCKPGPMYYVVHREGGRLVRDAKGHNRKLAERALREVQVDVDRGTYRLPENIAFSDWADQWLKGLRRPKPNTVRSYISTLDYGRRAFGQTYVRRLTVADIDRFLSLMVEKSPSTANGEGDPSAPKPRVLSASTQAKHLRVLSACLSSAVAKGYASENPVSRLEAADKPRAEHREAGYFTDDELPRLLAEIPKGLMRTLFTVAVKSGLRQGELLALRWQDVDLQAHVLRVRRVYIDGRLGVTEPKTRHSVRDVNVTSDVVDLLGEWWGECGSPGDDALVFPGETPSGFLTGSMLTRGVLYPAMKRAGIERMQEETRSLRTFHSLRHTYARLAIENGAPLAWISKQLGHSSMAVTMDVYARHLGAPARQAEVEKLEGAFNF
jgi:integrase